MTISKSTTMVDFSDVPFNTNQTLLSSSSTTTTMISVTSLWIQTLTLTCMILIDISAFLGNLLVICAFFRTRRLQTVTNYFIASLAFADALVAIFVLPLSIYSYQRNRSWKLGLILCDLWVSSDVLLCTSSILNLTCISLDRYMAITRPLTYTAYRSKFLARVMILLVWIVSAVITCPPIFGWRDSNRRVTVEEEHRCDLNTARGYVVYSALGSFYIPAVIMIFVYIRIFMVVYDRENLINKFQDSTQNNPNNNNNNNNNNSTIGISSKTNQNGVTNISNDNNNTNVVKLSPKRCFCCCLYSRKQSSQNHPMIIHSTSMSQINNHNSNPERKQNGYVIYRFTNHQNNSTHSAPNTPPLLPKTKTFCRPCTISTKKMNNLSDEIQNNRRNYLSHKGAEYQFRTGDSPCYELKTFENSLPSLIKCRSHSFEKSPNNPRREYSADFIHHPQFHPSIKFNDKKFNEITALLLSDQTTNTMSNKPFNTLTGSLNDLSNDLTRTQQISNCQNNYGNKLSKFSTTTSAKSTSSTDQYLTNSSTYSNFHEQRSSPEQTRINRRMKPSRTNKSNPSAILIENFKQQHKLTGNNNNSSLKSNLSSRFPRRINDNHLKQSSCCCWTPFNHCFQKQNKRIHNSPRKRSLTHDEEDDEKLSSNDTNLRTPIRITSNTNLRTLTQSNSNLTLTSHHQSPTVPLSNNPSNDVHRRERIRFMKEQKTAKTLAVVVGGFILFWLPFFIMYVIPPQTLSFNAQTVTLITWLGYFNSVINPFIYAYCSKQFRMAFWNITFGMCWKKSNTLLPISVKTKPLYRRRNIKA